MFFPLARSSKYTFVQYKYTQFKNVRKIKSQVKICKESTKKSTKNDN